jgi:mono/diheme cytochrome c family protein
VNILVDQKPPLLIAAWLLTPFCGQLCAAGAQPGALPAPPAELTAFTQTYCIECHGPKKQKGDFRVDELKISENAADAENWRSVRDNLQLGDMPPKEAKEAKRPPAGDVEKITAWIDTELKRASLTLAGQRPQTILRRLNRLEYENTIEDLFGVHGNYSAGFPEDAKFGGFDNNGAALMLSAEQMDQYLKAADFILSRAIVLGPQPETKKVPFTLKRFADGRIRPATGKPFFEPYGQDYILTGAEFRFPETSRVLPVRTPGWYRLKITTYAARNDGKPVELLIRHGVGVGGLGKERVLDGITKLTDAQPVDVEYRTYLQPGESFEIGTTPKYLYKKGEPDPAVVIKSMEMEGPLIDEWPPRGMKTLFGATDPEKWTDDAVPGLLRDVALKLFRRPVNASVVEEFASFFREQRKARPLLEAYRLTVKAMMASPLFLYHVEPAPGVDEYALANRLSYFLWRSVPDDTLLALAAQHALSQPAQLKQQFSRMLADPRSERFLTDFLNHWLQLSKVGEMQPDSKLYPEYTAELERAMVAETRLFMRELLANDLSLANLIDSDWTMLNGRLARHYGIAGVTGPEFRKVQLDKTKTVRGGLLTQASILSLTSNGTTTSPVIRGVWVLEHLLGTPPSPPPPDVPAIEPDIRGATTINEQLAKHRTNAQCAACHAKIDPYGMALENFDVIGGWRTSYRALLPIAGRRRTALGDGKLVNATDTLPKLGAFHGFTEFRALLKQREPLVFHNVAGKLASYALGRATGFTDQGDLDAIVKTTQAGGGGFRTMLEALVLSPMFQRP